MPMKKGLYRILACPCGSSALQQEDGRLFRCGQCGRVRTLDGSPPPLDIKPITCDDGTFFEDMRDWQKWQDKQLAACALPPEMLGKEKLP